MIVVGWSRSFDVGDSTSVHFFRRLSRPTAQLGLEVRAAPPGGLGCPSLGAVRPAAADRRPHGQEIVAKAENTVSIGVQLGELLPITWRAAFHVLFRPNLASWKSAKEFDAFRQEVRALFYTVREALDESRKTAEMLQTLT